MRLMRRVSSVVVASPGCPLSRDLGFDNACALADATHTEQLAVLKHCVIIPITHTTSLFISVLRSGFYLAYFIYSATRHGDIQTRAHEVSADPDPQNTLSGVYIQRYNC